MDCLIGVKDAKPALEPEQGIKAIKAKSTKITKRRNVLYVDLYQSINAN